MNKKLLSLIILPTFLLTLGSCGDKKGPDTEGKPDEQVTAVNYETAINKLRKGFKANAKLTTTKNYFLDPDHLNAAEDIPSVVEDFESVFTYTDKSDYIGFDYKFYKLEGDKKKYLEGDNFYNNDGYIMFNYIGYDNVLRNDSYATDDYNNLFPYASSGLINPFKLIKKEDFTQDGKLSMLSREKTNVLVSMLFSQIVSIPANINNESNVFLFEGNDLKQAKLTTFPYNLTETIGSNNVFPQITYDLVLDFSEIGTADAEHEIKEEPEKVENIPLQEALDNLASARNYRVRRHFKGKDKGEPITAEESIDVYYDGLKQAIYQSVFQYQETEQPTASSESDALYIDDPKDSDTNLDALMYQVTADGSYKFMRTNQLPAVDNTMSYKDFTLQHIGEVDANIFNLNDDGSYSPIASNVALLASDCFVPFLNTTSEIDGGYIDDFKLYLADDGNIDKIVLTSKYYKFDSTITISYDKFGVRDIIPFDALNNIVW